MTGKAWNFTGPNESRLARGSPRPAPPMWSAALIRRAIARVFGVPPSWALTDPVTASASSTATKVAGT
jgi:hypothetical protein